MVLRRWLLGLVLSLASGPAFVLAQTPVAPPRDNPQLASLAGTGIIRGRVVVDGSDPPVPIRSARISADPGPSAPEPVFSDDEGRFELAGLAAGRYVLVAEKTGFARTRYGSKGDLDPAQPIQVVDGIAVQNVDIRLPKGAAILGRIVNDVGDPLVGAAVSLAIAQVVGAEAKLVAVPRAYADTNDRGEYRIGDLPAGRYIVSVAGTSEGLPLTGAPPEWSRTTGWMKTFYPAAPTAAGASPIALNAGEEHPGIDFALQPSRPAKLTLSLAETTGMPTSALINLFLPADIPGAIADNRAVPLSSPTARMTPTLQPGDWIAVALGKEGRSITRVSLSSGEERSVTVSLGPGARIAGRVLFEGSGPPPALTTVRLGVRGVGPDLLTPAPGLSGGPVTVRADGAFEMTGVIGTIELQPTTPLRGWILRTVTFGNRDLLDEPLALTGTEDISGVQLIFTDALAHVDGIALKTDGQPAAGCAVALLPDGGTPQLASRRARLQRTDQNGRFVMSDLLSGSYLAVAITDIDAAMWLGSDYRDHIRAAATRLTVADRDKQSISLPCDGAR